MTAKTECNSFVTLSRLVVHIVGRQTDRQNLTGLSATEHAPRVARGSRAAEQRDELAPFWIELHAIPHTERGPPQDIELAAISQRVVQIKSQPPARIGVEANQRFDDQRIGKIVTGLL